MSSVVETEVYRMLTSRELFELVGEIVEHVAAVPVAFPPIVLHGGFSVICID